MPLRVDDEVHSETDAPPSTAARRRASGTRADWPHWATGCAPFL